MLIGILFLLLVLAVGGLIAVDMVKSPDLLHELGDAHPYLDAHPYPTERAVIGTRAFTQEPAGSGLAAGAHEAGQSWRPDSVGGHRRPGSPSASARNGSRGELKNWPVGLRLVLLAIIPAIGAAVVTLSITRVVSSLHSQAGSADGGDVVSAFVAVLVLIVVLVLALGLTIVVGRSVLRPLHRLRARALEVADAELPDAIRLAGESAGQGGTPPRVAPVGVDSLDELGDVAQAFDKVHKEALRLAASEAAVRGRVNAVFVNLSRRSQVLVDSQIRLIDDLEQEEQQPERRAELFRLDRLITRMRRYSQNLLIMAGHEQSGHSNQPISLVNVIRAAVSEIEGQDRVSMNAQPGIAVAGPAVDDVVHLLTELAENATALSAADTPVLISAGLLAGGGALIDITDRGFGMSAEEMAEANWRLDHSQASDITVSKSIGLSVVGRLAARHDIKIRLRPAESGGLTALVWLPNAILLQQEATASPGTGLGVAGSRPVAPLQGRTGRFG
jgi:signal transduction histidine kinase